MLTQVNVKHFRSKGLSRMVRQFLSIAPIFGVAAPARWWASPTDCIAWRSPGGRMEAPSVTSMPTFLLRNWNHGYETQIHRSGIIGRFKVVWRSWHQSVIQLSETPRHLPPGLSGKSRPHGLLPSSNHRAGREGGENIQEEMILLYSTCFTIILLAALHWGRNRKPWVFRKRITSSCKCGCKRTCGPL